VAPTILITNKLTTIPSAATLWAWRTGRNEGAQWMPIATWPQAMPTTVHSATTRHALEPQRAMLSTAMMA
jgi:hypothetical protein